ncbi:MAG: alpha/beta hydrolase [Ruminococcaceae bacterium]|nr:alpha/beta hydrolase [Oscillospiraceae bacterium]
MHPLIIVSIVLAALIVLVLLAALVCFIMVFYSGKRKVLGPDEYEIPPGKIYEAFREDMIGWTKQIREMPHEDIEIKSYDGLTLRGTYYECAPDATVELLFHGYRGNAERDLCGGIERCFALGRSAIIIDQRAGGKSDGHVITFGIRERYDCLSWIDYATKRFGKDRKIVIGGVSMGAATVMLAAGEELPENVVCVMADCGYTSAKDIIKKVVKDLKLPLFPIYPLIRLGGRLYGGFDVEETSPMEAVQKARVPIVFIHGDTDAFVPYDMSVKLHEACVSQKKMVTIKGAGHGLAFPVDRAGYVQGLREFEEQCGF